MHNKIDKIYFLIEDDIFPFNLPSNIQCINVSKQTYFPNNCKNYKKYWGGYMDLMRTVLTKILPQENIILSLDVDTIIQEDISELWNYDLTNYYIAAARETPKLNKNGLNVNVGVCLFNLNKIRQDKKDEELIYLIKNKSFTLPMQDPMNIVFKHFILELPSAYNSCPRFQGYDPNNRKIIHFAGNRQYLNDPIVQKYKKLLEQEGLERGILC